MMTIKRKPKKKKVTTFWMNMILLVKKGKLPNKKRLKKNQPKNIKKGKLMKKKIIKKKKSKNNI